VVICRKIGRLRVAAVGDDEVPDASEIGVAVVGRRRQPGSPDLLRFRRQELPVLEAGLGRQAAGPVSGNQHVRQRVHYLAGQGDRVLIVLKGADRAGCQGAAIHDAGVELDLAQQIRQSAVAD
jgi:hypothetical protein